MRLRVGPRARAQPLPAHRTHLPRADAPPVHRGKWSGWLPATGVSEWPRLPTWHVGVRRVHRAYVDVARCAVLAWCAGVVCVA